MTKLARASALQFAVNIGQTIIGALVTIYFVRILGVGVFGQYVLALAIVKWLMIPSVGVRSSTMKRISEGHRQAEFFAGGLAAQLLFGGAIVLSILMARHTVNSYVGFDAAALVAALFITKSTARFLTSVIRGENRVELSSLIEGGWSIATSVFQFVLVTAGAGLVGLVEGEILAAGLAIVVAFIATRSGLALPTKRDFSRLYEYGRYSWFSNLKTMSYSWMDTILLGIFVTSEIVGAYEVAWRISALFILFPIAIGKVLFPTISQRAASNRSEEIERILSKSLSFAGLFAIPGVAGAVVIGEEVLGLYGNSVTQIPVTVVILIILSIARIAEAYEILLLQTLNALDYPDRTFRISIVFTVLNISLNLVLIHLIGAVGAAIATTASVILSVILALRAFPDEISLTVSRPAVVAQLISTGIMAGVLWVLLSMRPIASEVDVLVYVFLGALLYVAGLLVFSKEARGRAQQVIVESVGSAGPFG